MNDIVKTSVKSNWRDILPVHPACEIIPPNSPSPGITVAFIEHNGAPVEFLQIVPSSDRVSVTPNQD